MPWYVTQSRMVMECVVADQIAVWFWPAEISASYIPAAVRAPANTNVSQFIDTGDVKEMSHWGKPDAYFGNNGANATCPLDAKFNKHEIIINIT